MTEQESLLLDVGNALGVLALVGAMFILATGCALIFQGIKDAIK